MIDANTVPDEADRGPSTAHDTAPLFPPNRWSHDFRASFFFVFFNFYDYLHPAETEFQGTRNGDERNAPRLISLPPVGISASPHAPPQTEIFCSPTKLRRGGGGKLICWRQLTKATRSVSFLDFGPLLLRLRLRPGGEAAKGGDDAE
jgi:hypothetical protein